MRPSWYRSALHKIDNRREGQLTRRPAGTVYPGHVFLFSANANACDQEGLTHGFVVQFTSKEDRDYYVNQDPAHEAFKSTAGPFIEKAVVFDFQDGVFMHTASGLYEAET